MGILRPKTASAGPLIPFGKLLKPALTMILGGVTSAPILVNFVDVAGSVCGALLPTGHTSDVVEGIRVTCIDNGMPVVVIPAASVGRTGYEGVAQLNADAEFFVRFLAGT